MKKVLLFLIATLLIFISHAQWTTVDLIDFNGADYETDVATGGSPYWDNSVSPPSGPRNGLINGSWEVKNTGLGATQIPSDASNGRFLMYWSHKYSSSPGDIPGNVWSRTYSGLTIGMQYRYSIRYGTLVCAACTAPSVSAQSSLMIRIDGADSLTLPSIKTTWTTATFIFTATAATHTISIYNNNGQETGNDFGLDDIKLESSLLYVMPVKLLSFRAEKIPNGSNVLEWETANEINLSRFIIEASLDGKYYRPVGSVKTNGNVAGDAYHFKHDGLMSGVSYYRLVATDIDGNKEYSNVILLKNENYNGVKFYPNPARDHLNLINQKAGDIIRIINSAGQVLITEKISQSNTTMDITKLPKGLYFIYSSNATVTGSQYVSLLKL